MLTSGSYGFRGIVSPTRTLSCAPHEKRAIEWLLEGYSDKEIAMNLGVSPDTVRGYFRKIYSKTGINTRLRLALWAIGKDL
jgi:DNA-binding CsgD family transcriptional regulator